MYIHTRDEIGKENGFGLVARREKASCFLRLPAWLMSSIAKEETSCFLLVCNVLVANGSF
jgi:hypothetical protein